MKKLFVLLALVMGAMSVNAQHLGSEYRLKKVIPVAGRQGIAVDKDYYYVSDTKVLYKYDKEGNMLMKNDQPFQSPGCGSGGRLCWCEWFQSRRRSG